MKEDVKKKKGLSKNEKKKFIKPVYDRNLIKGIKTCIKEELRQMNPRRKEVMTIHEVLHTRDDIDLMWQEKNVQEDCMNATIQKHEECTKKCGKRQITATSNSNNINRNNSRTTKKTVKKNY